MRNNTEVNQAKHKYRRRRERRHSTNTAYNLRYDCIFRFIPNDMPGNRAHTLFRRAFLLSRYFRHKGS